MAVGCLRPQTRDECWEAAGGKRDRTIVSIITTIISNIISIIFTIDTQVAISLL